jgi:hypothetical protein
MYGNITLKSDSLDCLSSGHFFYNQDFVYEVAGSGGRSRNVQHLVPLRGVERIVLFGLC